MPLEQLDTVSRNTLSVQYRRDGYAVVPGVRLPAPFEPPVTDIVFLQGPNECEVYIGARVRYNGDDPEWRHVAERPVAPGDTRLVATVRGDFFSGLRRFEELLKRVGGFREEAGADVESEAPRAVEDEREPPSPRPGLRDLVQAAREWPDRYAGREGLVEELITSLARQSKPGVVLTGRPGVGKTALVHMLAKRFASGDNVPPALLGSPIFEFPIGALVENARYAGAVERETRCVLEQAQERRPIFFVDEFHQLERLELRPLCDLMKPALAEGRIRLIGATTSAEWRRFQDGAFKRRFLEIAVEEPAPVDAYEMVRRRTADLEAHHRLRFPDELVRTAVMLADRYAPHRTFPDKALDVLDHAAAMQKAGSGASPVLEKEWVLRAAAVQSGLRPELLSPETYLAFLDRAAATLKQRLVGQDEAVDVLVETLRGRVLEGFVGWEQACSALQPVRDRRPMATLLAVGPTGSGKTETAKILAEVLFEGRIIFLNGSDAGPEAPHGVATWVGSPPGYVGSDRGGVLTDGLRAQRSAVIVVDEIDKASQEALQNCLLPLLGEGVVTDRNNGETLWATDCLVFCTGNMRSSLAGQRSAGFHPEGDKDCLRRRPSDRVIPGLQPEVVGRFNLVVHYRTLPDDDLRKIFQRLLRKLESQMGPGTYIELDETASTYIQGKLAKCSAGARDVIDVFRTAVIPPVAKMRPGTLLKLVLAPGGANLEAHAVQQQPTSAHPPLNAPA